MSAHRRRHRQATRQTGAPAGLLAVLLAAGLLLALIPGPAAAQLFQPPWDGDPATVARVGGDTPRTFAIELARTQPDNSAGQAVVVSDESFADALSASGLGGFGVLFFAGPDRGLDDEALVEMARLLPDGATVYLVGGTAALTSSLEPQLTGAGFTPRRLAGPSRVETALAVADEVVATSFAQPLPDVLLARAFGPADSPTAAWADSVAAGPVAAANAVPILLTPTDALHPAVAQWLQTNLPARATALGGEAAISAAALADVAVPVRRVAGATRDETAERIVHQLARDGFGPLRSLVAVNLTDELGWAYGLAVAPVASARLAGIVAVNPDVDLVPSQRLAACGRPMDLVVAGPTSLVPDARVEGLRTCPPGIEAGSAPGDPLALRGDGLGADIDFGLDDATTVARLTDALGAPTSDSGRVQPFCKLAGPEDPAGRTVSFAGGLTAGFREVAGQMFFEFYLHEGDSALATPTGITTASTNADVGAAFGADARFQPGDEFGFPPPIWSVDTPAGPLSMLSAGNDDSAAQDAIAGGPLQFCE